MKKLFLILLFVPLVCFGQTKEEMELCIAFQTKSFYSNSEAENALDKILSVTGLKKNFTLTACDGINNAMAISLKGERYILYDKNFMKNIGGSSSNIAILAHEIGHHLNNHARDITMYIGGVIEPDSKEVSRRQELEADEFAGFVMARLGYSLEEAKQPFYKISSNKDDSYSTHPSRGKRLASITKGYNDGKIVTKEKIVYVTKEIPVIKEKIVYVTEESKKKDMNELDTTDTKVGQTAQTEEKPFWYDKLLMDSWEKLKNMIFENSNNQIENENSIEEINNIPKPETVIVEKPQAFKLTTEDIYIDNFNKKPDYGNYIDVSSSYFTYSILYSRTTEVLSTPGHKRYGKLYEGLSYVNREMEIREPSYVPFSDRAEIRFYLGDYDEALNDINKSFDLLDDRWMLMYHLELRSKIKYMLGDIKGAIEDLKEKENYFYNRSKKDHCGITYYYWFSLYYLALNDYSTARLYLDKINSFPDNIWGCPTYAFFKTKAIKLSDIINKGSYYKKSLP